jgi:NDP-sugar pyrophosphorylase family protein
LKTIILAGGLGTRLRPITYSIPKPLLPVGRRPILEIQIMQLKAQGFSDIILATGYRAELIEAYFGDGKGWGVRIIYSKEEERLGTASPLRLVKHLLDESFLVLNGDVLVKMNFSHLMQFHKAEEATITVATKEHAITVPYGVIEGEGVCVKQIKEKPTLHFPIAAGIYVLEPSVIDLIPEGKYYDMPDLIRSVLQQGWRVLNYPIKGRWIDMGAFQDLEEANKDIRFWEEE